MSRSPFQLQVSPQAPSRQQLYASLLSERDAGSLPCVDGLPGFQLKGFLDSGDAAVVLDGFFEGHVAFCPYFRTTVNKLRRRNGYL